MPKRLKVRYMTQTLLYLIHVNRQAVIRNGILFQPHLIQDTESRGVKVKKTLETF